MDNKFEFSKKALLALPLPPASQRANYYDLKTPKLALRVTAAGTKTFYVIRRTGAEMVWFKLGVFNDMTVEQARNEAARVLGSFAGQDNPAAVRRAAKAMPTLAEFFVEYGTRHASRKKSWRDDQQRFRDYLQNPLGNKKLDHITREMLGRILSDMDRNGKAGATVNQVRSLASGMFTKAIEWSYVATNPVQGIKTRPTNKRDRFLQSNELPRFFAALALETNDTLRDYFLLSLLTGARRENVLAMRWANLQLNEGIWRIPMTKNGEPQNVTLSPEAITILQTRHKARTGAEFVFPGTGKSGHLVEPKAAWRRILDRDELAQLNALLQAKSITVSPDEASDGPALSRARAAALAAGIQPDGVRLPDLRIHDLRRTLGSWQARTGASMAIIGKSLNHKSQQTTAIYARLDLDPVRASVNTATSAMMAAAGLAPTAQVIAIPARGAA